MKGAQVTEEWKNDGSWIAHAIKEKRELWLADDYIISCYNNRARDVDYHAEDLERLRIYRFHIIELRIEKWRRERSLQIWQYLRSSKIEDWQKFNLLSDLIGNSFHEQLATQMTSGHGSSKTHYYPPCWRKQHCRDWKSGNLSSSPRSSTLRLWKADLFKVKKGKTFIISFLTFRPPSRDRDF